MTIFTPTDRPKTTCISNRLVIKGFDGVVLWRCFLWIFCWHKGCCQSQKAIVKFYWASFPIRNSAEDWLWSSLAYVLRIVSHCSISVFHAFLFYAWIYFVDSVTDTIFYQELQMNIVWYGLIYICFQILILNLVAKSHIYQVRCWSLLAELAPSIQEIDDRYWYLLWFVLDSLGPPGKFSNTPNTLIFL